MIVPLNRRVRAGLLCCTLLCACHAPAPTRPAASIYPALQAASVEVLIAGRLEGSGWFADARGHVITAAHVVWPHVGKPIELRSSGAGRVPAQVVAFDRGHDIVLLRADPRPEPYPHLSMADRLPAPGEAVYLFGAPLFRHAVMVTGAMARPTASYEYLADQKAYLRANFISAPSPQGTSGGAWVDRHGRVIGNQSAFMANRGVAMGIAMVTPLKAIADLVREKRDVHTPTLGTAFEELPSQPAGFIARFPPGAEGLVPVMPVPGGAAEQAKFTGEWLVRRIDGRPVRDRDTALNYVRSKQPGQKVVLEAIAPDGKGKRTFEIQLGDLLERR